MTLIDNFRKCKPSSSEMRDSRSVASWGEGGGGERRAGPQTGVKKLLGMMDMLVTIITVMVS